MERKFTKYRYIERIIRAQLCGLGTLGPWQLQFTLQQELHRNK
jgi:hypothetical protein